MPSQKEATSLQNRSALELDAACQHGTKTDSKSSSNDIDWHKAFRTLSALIGNDFVTSDMLNLLARNLLGMEGEEVAMEFAKNASLNRSSFHKSFMG